MILPIIDDQGKIKEIQKALGVYSSKAPSVLANALNATATQVQKQIKKYIKQNYALSSKEQKTLMGKERMSIERARATGKFAATIHVKSESLHLSSFETSPTQPTTSNYGGVKARVLKKEPLKTIESHDRIKAFIAKFQNGKIAVVQRVPGKKYQKISQRRDRQYPGWTPPNDITKIKALFGNSYPMMAKKAFERSDGEINKILQEQINKRIAQTLAKEAAKHSK